MISMQTPLPPRALAHLRTAAAGAVSAAAGATLRASRDLLREAFRWAGTALRAVREAFVRSRRDRLRQGLGLLFATTQYLAPYLAFVTGIGVDIATRASQGEPVAFSPAGYTFGIWAYLYPACLAYAVYGLLPSQRESVLFRRTGWYMALVFLANTLWALAAQLATEPWYWLTVLCIVVMLLGLVGAFVEVTRRRAPLSRAERLLVAVPIGVFAAWITVATIANTASMLTLYGFSGTLLSDTAWAIVMTAVAGAVGVFVTRASRDAATAGTSYALTIVWALVGLVAGSLGSAGSLALVAAGAACAVLLACLPPHRPASSGAEG